MLTAQPTRPVDDTDTDADTGSGTPPGVGSPSSAWRAVLADPRVVTALIIGAVVRIGWLGHQAWFVDEAAEFDAVNRSIGDITTHVDGFPPVSSYVLKAWINVFGYESSRVLALVAGLVTLVVIVVLAQRLWGRGAAVATAWLAALSPTLVWTSQEVRPYGYVIALTAVAMLLAEQLTERPTDRRYLTLGLVLSLGCLVHYFFPIVAGLVLVLAGLRLRTHPSLRRGAVLALAPLALTAIPVALLVFDDLGLQQEFTSSSEVGSGVAEIGYSSVSLLTGATVGPGLRALHDLPAADAVRQMAPWLALLTVPLVVTAREVWTRRRTDDALLGLVAMVAAGIAAIAVLTLAGGTGFRPRYVVWAIVPVLLVLARALSVAPRRAAVVGAAVLAVIFCVALYNRNYSDEHRVEAIDEVVEAIDASAHADAPIMATAGMHLVVDLYLDDGRSAIILPGLAGARGLAEGVDFVVDTADGSPAWIVYSRHFDHDPDKELLRALRAEGAVLQERFAGADLYLINGPPVPDPAS